MVELEPTHFKGETSKKKRKKKKKKDAINFADFQPDVCLTSVDDSKIPPTVHFKHLN